MHRKSARGIIAAMNQLLLMLSIVVASSIGCATSRSANSQSIAGSNPTSVQIAPAITSKSAPATRECTLRLDAAPNIKGLSLRMTPEEVLALFPGAKSDPEIQRQMSGPPRQFGISNLMIRPEKYESRDRYTDINQISFSFLDGRVSKIHVGFTGPEWPDVDKFVAKIVEGTSLPPADQWSPYVGLDNQLKMLTCVDFEVRVFAGGKGGNLNYVQVQDLEADKKLKERRKKAQECGRC